MYKIDKTTVIDQMPSSGFDQKRLILAILYTKLVKVYLVSIFIQMFTNCNKFWEDES